jgi:hypothetical protein
MTREEAPMKRATLILAAAVALLLGGVGQARADLITNGGFETGDFTGWTTTKSGEGSLRVVTGAAHNGNYGAQ